MLNKYLPNIYNNNFSSVYLQENQNFRLSQPKKGKLLSGKIYSAFTKNKMSSIPRDNEVIILDEKLKNSQFVEKLKKSIQNTLNISNKTQKTDQKSEITYDSENINNKTIFEDSIIINNKYLKSKSMSNIFKTRSSNKNLTQINNNKSERFNYYNEFISKYQPGPGYYNIENNKKDSNNLRYKNLYNNNNSKDNNHSVLSNIINKSILNNPGPGSYSPLFIDDIYNKNYLSLNSKEKRFIELEKEDIGPGSYFIDILKDYNNLRPNNYPLSSFVLKNSKYDNLSKKLKKEMILNKYINLYKPKKYEVPGPGKYNFKSTFEIKKNSNKNNYVENFLINNLKIDKAYVKNLNLEDSFNLIPEEIKEEYNKYKDIENEETEKDNNEKKVDKLRYNEKEKYSVENDKYYFKGIRSPFLSKTKKNSLFINKNHNPGPCYYFKDNK